MKRRRAGIGVFCAAVVVTGLAASGVIAAGSPGEMPGTPPGPVAAAAPDPAPAAAEPQQPVQISADLAEYFNKEGRVVFNGNVVAVQGDSTIAADSMDVSFEQPERGEGSPAEGIGAPANARRITSIVARKNVSFRQLDPETGKERFATGDKGVYDVDQRLVTMTGKPRLWEGKNVIVGEEMVFYLAEKKVIVKGKVNLTVYPDDLKEEKKP